MAGTLWIIEAPGKANTLAAILPRIGLTNCHVKATIGHIMGMPDKLKPIGIDRQLHEFMRRPLRDGVVEQILVAAEAATKVIIATDADAEGDVIATDVADLISALHPEPLRVRLRGMDDESVLEAFKMATPLRREDATSGRTRAILDRIIGATFSADGIAVGRVSTALLGLAASGTVTPHRLALVAPARDGGRPWRAECDVLAPLTMTQAERLSQLSLPMLDLKSSSVSAPPPEHTGDIMVRAAEMFDVQPAEVAKAMQSNYEAAKMSYPRSSSRGLSRSAARKMRRILEQAGARFNEDIVADKPEGSPHDAPHPLGPVQLALDPMKLGLNEGVRQMVARNLAASGVSKTVHRANTQPLIEFLVKSGFPDAVARHVAGLDWRRELGPSLTRENWGKSSILHRRPDAALLEAAVNHGLGTASTWGDHIKRFIDRGLVDDNLALTDKGRQWLRASPQALLDFRLAGAIERAIESRPVLRDGVEPWQIQAQRIISALPEQLRTPMVAAIDVSAPQEDMIIPMLNEEFEADIGPAETMVNHGS